MAKAIDRADKIYDVAALFAQECFIGSDSFLWPGNAVWTSENIQLLWDAYIGNPDGSDKSFLEKWSQQLSGLSEDVYRLAVESMALYCLFPYKAQMGPARKLSLVNEVIQLGPELKPMDESRWGLLQAAFREDGVGRAGTDYNTKRPFHLAYYLAFAREFKRDGVTSLDEIDPIEYADDALYRSAEETGHHANGSRNAVLNLVWPNRFEPTASNNHKERMAQNLSSRYDLKLLNDVDKSLLKIRQHMETNEGFSKDFDMYDQEIRQLWDFPPTSPDPPEPENGGAGGSSETESGTTSSSNPSIAELAETTFLEESFLRDIESLLESKQQLIFEGPPGSGKTYVAEKFARYFAGVPLNDSDPNDQVELVQFHQSYSYEDFVEGIRPRTNEDGNLVYDVEPGIFREFADRAHANRDKRFVLIIDEINRGNVSRILGELMLLLEYRDKSARLPYSKSTLQIPPNLYIIGTMNTADRSLSTIDYALRRRFYFIRFMAVSNNQAPVLEGWLHRQNVEPQLRQRILGTFIGLNNRLRDHLDTDDLQVGHSYFMHAQIADESFRQHVWKYAVLPLIREYLYHHRERDELLATYELESFRTIVEPIAQELGDSAPEVVREDSGEGYQ